jgi:hypothetical protein
MKKMNSPTIGKIFVVEESDWDREDAGDAKHRRGELAVKVNIG